MSPLRLDFVCVGPQKTSTSWLDAMLRQHPGLALPDAVKETFFFDRYHDRGPGWYRSLWTTPLRGRQVGEIGPSYFDDAEARRRLRQHNPALKILICLRDPVERTYSLFCHHYARGAVKGSFAEAVRAMPRIVSSGDYAGHAAAWAAEFGPAQLLLIRQEDVRDRPAVVLDAVCSFLGVPPVVWDQAGAAVYERPRPRSLLLSRAAAAVARTLRRFDLHRVVRLADRLGVRQLVFGARRFEYPALTAEDRSALTRRYQSSTDWIAGLDFSSGAVSGVAAFPRRPRKPGRSA